MGVGVGTTIEGIVVAPEGMGAVVICMRGKGFVGGIKNVGVETGAQLLKARKTIEVSVNKWNRENWKFISPIIL
jgi:hypothetical protein